MLKRATPIEFSRASTSGRTKPAHLLCETASDGPIEVVAKFSASCDQGVINLAREVIAACLGTDLGLPVPEAWLLDIQPEWVSSISDAAARNVIELSSPLAFGSRWAGAQFSAWIEGATLRPSMIPTALGIFVFDAIIQNPDRGSRNPNCLMRGEALRIFDHELALAVDVPLLGWKPPWIAGSLEHLLQPGAHIFTAKLRAEILDFTAIKESWTRIVDSRLTEYAAAIPVEWAAAMPAMTKALKLIADARDRIDECLTEVRRVLR